jgi:UDP-glucose 4-epimerase
MLLAIESTHSSINIYNLGHTDTIEVNDSIAIIARALGAKPRIEYTGGERGWVGDSPRIDLHTGRIRALGWKPTRSIAESVVETLGFLESNPFAARRT